MIIYGRLRTRCFDSPVIHSIRMTQFNKKCLYALLFVLFHGSVHADEGGLLSLFAYSGYLTTPSAYIKDGRLSFHYSYLPQDVSVYYRGVSDNRIFSVSLGFFPFMECYFSVYVAPSIKWIYNYGSIKTRSPGVKFKILNEKKYVPAIALGVFDPNIEKVGAHFSSENISSTFLVLSKKFPFRQSSVSIGYGVNSLRGRWARLEGVFGGINIHLSQHISLVVDYDTKEWCKGISAGWHGFDAIIAIIDNTATAYRIGYNFNLYNR